MQRWPPPTPEQLDMYRRMTPAERIRIACSLHDLAHQRLAVHLSPEHPQKPECEILVLARSEIPR